MTRPLLLVAVLLASLFSSAPIGRALMHLNAKRQDNPGAPSVYGVKLAPFRFGSALPILRSSQARQIAAFQESMEYLQEGMLLAACFAPGVGLVMTAVDTAQAVGEWAGDYAGTAAQHVLPRRNYGGGLHSYRGINAVDKRLDAVTKASKNWDEGRQAAIAELALIRQGTLNGSFS